MIHSLKPFDDGRYLSEEEAMKLLESIPIPKELEEKKEIPPVPKNTTKRPAGKYLLMPVTKTYALGLRSLQAECIKENNPNHPLFTFPDNSKIYRPLTFKENIQARVENYETTHDPDGSKRTLEKRLYLITGRRNDSCTTIVYQAGTTKFKIVPISKHLITLNYDFKQDFLQADYKNITGAELDSENGIYNANLKEEDVLNHPAWLAAVEDDKALLKSYSNIIFKEFKRKYNTTEGMNFGVKQNTVTDELRALLIYNLYYNSYADGYNDLGCSGSFLRRIPSSEASLKSRGAP